jgi:hypothetical protein
LDAAKRYLRTREDVIEQYASVKPIRANYLASESVAPTKNCPHVKFYDFCRPLVDIDFAHQIDSAVDGYSKVVEYFNDRQDQNQAQSLSGPNAETMSIGTAKNDLEQEQSFAAEAAVPYAAIGGKCKGRPRSHCLLNSSLENGLVIVKKNKYMIPFRMAHDFLRMQRPLPTGTKHKPKTSLL